MKLEGKVAVVTGSGRNLGRSIAIALAKEGASVAVNGLQDRAKVDEVVGTIRANGGTAFPFMADVSDPDQVKAMIEAVRGELGVVDIVVSNAALRPGKSMLELTPAEWRKVIAVNLDAAFFLCQETIPGMIEKGGGSIIAMSGLVAFGMRAGGAGPVAASKAGLIGLMRGVAREYGVHGIRANSIVIGSMATDRYDQRAYLEGRPVEYLGPSPLTSSSHTRTESLDRIALRRRGTPEEAASTCAFLASPDGGYITGQAIHLNGGFYMS